MQSEPRMKRMMSSTLRLMTRSQPGAEPHSIALVWMKSEDVMKQRREMKRQWSDGKRPMEELTKQELNLQLPVTKPRAERQRSTAPWT